MSHWQPKTEITRDAESDLPIQAIVGRTAKKPTAVYQQDAPDMNGPITRSNDYVAVPKTTPAAMVAAAPAPPQVEFAPPPTAPVISAPQPVQNHQQPPGHTMPNDQNHPTHQHPVQAYPAQTWYGGQPHAYAPQPLVVQQLPAQMHAVQTNQAPDVTYRKGILGIGSEAFDLTGEMLDSFEFKAKFIMFLTQVLAQDLNVQAALFTPNEKKQDGEIAALAAADKVLKHAIQCAFYEDGDIVFPGLKNDCGKDARIKVPPVNGIKYDLYTSTLSIGSAEVVIPVADIAAQTVTSALNAAATALPKVRKAEDITDLPVFDRDDQCAPAKSATIAQLTESVMTNGLVDLCEQGKLVDIPLPTRLLAFGAKCAEIGFTSISALLQQLNAALPLAPRGQFPVELRGFASLNGTGEQRYPVVITEKKVLSAGGPLLAAGDSAGGILSSMVSLTVPTTDFYLVTGSVNGFIHVDSDSQLSSGMFDRRVLLRANDADFANQGDVTYFNVSDSDIAHTASISAATWLAAGTVISVYAGYSGGGVLSTGRSYPVSGSITAVPLGLTSISINPA